MIIRRIIIITWSANHMLSTAIFFLCTLLLCSPLVCCAATRDDITSGHLISDGAGETLVSAGERFELGFFTPDGNNNYSRYVGIWYYMSKPQPPTIVWVANRENPLPEFAIGVFGLKVEDGNLVVVDGEGNSYFSTGLENTSSSHRTVKLLDSGNLVLSDDQSGNVLWQSFDNPTDTFLPGMKMDEKLKLTSWKSREDPASGNFTFEQDEGGENHYLIQKRSIRYWRNEESGKFISYNKMLNPVSSLLSSRNFSVLSGMDYNHTRLVMNYSGEIQYYIWDSKKGWSLTWSAPTDTCSVSNFCGNFGSCNSNSRLVCKCLPGFNPSSPDNWNSGDFSDGCTRNSTKCTGSDTFLSLKMMKVENSVSQFDDAKTVEKCRRECLDIDNCRCKAYSYINETEIPVQRSTGKAGCWIWTEDLGDLQEEYADGGSDLYVRVVASDIGSTTRSCEACGTNMIPYPLSTGSNCGDPLYSNFLCDSSTGQVSFQSSRDTYRVTSINPNTHKFVIQGKGADICGARNSRGKVLPPDLGSLPLPFNVTDFLCYVDPGTVSSNKSSHGSYEVEIGWYPPQEPTCNSSRDCKDWPNSSCNAKENGKRRCLCNANYRWDGLSLNCTQEVLGNPKQSEGAGHQGSSFSLNAVGISMIVIVVVLLLCSISYIAYRRIVVAKKQESRENIQGDPVLRLYDSERRVKELIDSDQFKEDHKKDIDVPFFDLESILAATDSFSVANKLGQGGFGPVYKGKFPGGQEIAVKRLSSHSGQGLEEFKNEVVLIAKLQHRNLVRLLGYCIKGDEKILLYEYMPNKSLDAFIFDRPFCKSLDWEKRFEIILGVARGLLYLHQDSRLRIIHRDLKTSNILLDEEMNPKISDFGLARIVGGKETEANTNKVVGTYGYMSPEYALDGQFSVKSDVFSFGVVMLEIISGKRNTGFYQSQQAMNLLGHAWRLWKEEKALDLMDQTLLESCNRGEVLKCIIVGLLCVQEDPGDRPAMSNVVFMLGSEIATLPNPKQPAFVARKFLSSAASSSSSKPDTRSNNELTITVEEGR